MACFSDETVYGFIEHYLDRRNLPSVNIKEAGIWKFADVQMHIDSITNKGYHIIMIPIRGKGELAYMKDGRVVESLFDIKQLSARPIVFDDHLPHAFTSFSKSCYAILAAIPEAVAEKVDKLNKSV